MHTQLIRLLALAALSSQAFALTVPAPQAVKAASVKNGGLSTEGIETLDGVPIDAIPEGRSAPPANAKVVPLAAMDAWTATADTSQAGNDPSKALDGNTNTFWHSEYSPVLTQLPHTYTVDMKSNLLINSISYQPRQDGKPNGNIGQHVIQWSLNNVNWNTVAIGTWKDDASTKTTVFEAVTARYVRLQAITEAGGRGPWSSIAEFKVYTTTTYAPGWTGTAGGRWSPTIDFPLVPVSAALEFNRGDGKGTLLTWSSYAADMFTGGNGGQTITAQFDPTTQTVSQRTITNTAHDMFCPGINLDAQGRVFVTGGNSAPKFSIFNVGSQGWSAGPQMNIGRGYHAQVLTSTGLTFTIGGSWSGGEGGKDGEVYNPATNTWSKLPGCPVAPMLTADAQKVYRADNHAWLFAWKNGYVFQAGPSKAMNWYNPTGTGAYKGAGNRANDGDSMCGNAVMWDAVAGKILTVGGATSYQYVDSTANAHVITLGDPNTNPQVQAINPMNYQRIFANAVVLPTGNVFIVGGQVYGNPFSDDTSQFTPELWLKDTFKFVKLPPISIPRNYHSVGILLADATVFVGGSGLCGSCATNHFDAQVWNPGYLYNADSSLRTRPVINSVNGGNSATVNAGGTITVTVTGDASYWSLIRMGTTTHTVNTDQRRVKLTASSHNGNTFTLPLPGDRGILVPGPWMLFAMDTTGCPSIAKYILTT